MTPSPHREAAAPTECATWPRVLQPHSKPTAQARSQLPPEFLLFSQSRARSPPGPRPTPGRASCTPRQHLIPAGGGRGVRSRDLTAPARKPAARRPPALCRLTSSRRLGQRREGTSASRGSPAPFRRPPLWPGGAGPHSRAGPGARGGACQAAGFPPLRAASRPSLPSPSQTREDRRLPPGLKIRPRACYESAASPSGRPSRPQSRPSTHTFTTGHLNPPQRRRGAGTQLAPTFIAHSSWDP